MTPLGEAALGSSLEILQLLLEYPEVRAKINDCDSNGRTILFSAIDSLELVKVDFLLRQEVLDVNLADACGMTPLMYSLMSSRDMYLRLLRDGRVCKRHAMHFALRRKMIPVVRDLLLEKEIDINVIDGDLTPLQRCFDDELRELVPDFLGNPRLDINAKSNMTILESAVVSEPVLTVRGILSNSSLIVNDTDLSGRTALHHAVLVNRPDIVSVLLSCRGIDVNCTDLERKTPLYLAAELGYLDIVTMLLGTDGIDTEIKSDAVLFKVTRESLFC
jgi:ankyrin repeat protein